jgi:catechol 2,3-dioxygenase-like lactoylglutathione lyase family enzyme
MIDHLSIAVSDLARSAAFYEAVLAPLGYRRLVERPGTVGFGKRYPEVWINHRPGMTRADPDTGHHACLRASSVEAVDAFHAAALANGGADAGAPGPRSAAMTDYYGAFILDPDGAKLEAASFPKSET